MSGDLFVDFLKQHKEYTLFLVFVQGNSGDVLLQKGLEMYLRDNKYTLVDNALGADIILIHGGGNIDDVWYSGIALFKDVLHRYPDKEIVVAPSTCHFFQTDFSALLNSIRQEVHFFTRERNSYLRLKKMNLRENIHIYLADDTAFLLEGTEYLKGLKKNSRRDYTLFAFRTDRESAILPLESEPHKKNMWQIFVRAYLHWRLKRLAKRIVGSAYREKEIKIVDASFADFETFVSHVANAGDIYTDRLHVGILGAMLGKKVYLYKTKYDKIQGVYEQTLWLYPNVVKMF